MADASKGGGSPPRVRPPRPPPPSCVKQSSPSPGAQSKAARPSTPGDEDSSQTTASKLHEREETPSRERGDELARPQEELCAGDIGRVEPSSSGLPPAMVRPVPAPRSTLAASRANAAAACDDSSCWDDSLMFVDASDSFGQAEATNPDGSFWNSYVLRQPPSPERMGNSTAADIFMASVLKSQQQQQQQQELLCDIETSPEQQQQQQHQPPPPLLPIGWTCTDSAGPSEACDPSFASCPLSYYRTEPLIVVAPTPSPRHCRKTKEENLTGECSATVALAPGAHGQGAAEGAGEGDSFQSCVGTPGGDRTHDAEGSEVATGGGGRSGSGERTPKASFSSDDEDDEIDFEMVDLDSLNMRMQALSVMGGTESNEAEEDAYYTPPSFRTPSPNLLEPPCVDGARAVTVSDAGSGAVGGGGGAGFGGGFGGVAGGCGGGAGCSSGVDVGGDVAGDAEAVDELDGLKILPFAQKVVKKLEWRSQSMEVPNGTSWTGEDVTKRRHSDMPASTHKSSSHRTTVQSESLFEVSTEGNEEEVEFSRMVTGLRERFSHSDWSSNSGILRSPVYTFTEVCSVMLKVLVELDNAHPEPITFTCESQSPVELLLIQILCFLHPDFSQVDVTDYLLKVHGLDEVLQSDRQFGSHSYIQHCRRFDLDVRLKLARRSALRQGLARTEEDDARPTVLRIDQELHECPQKRSLTKQGLSMLMDVYHSEVETLLLHEQSGIGVSTDRVIQAAKALCLALESVETPAVTNAVSSLRHFGTAAPQQEGAFQSQWGSGLLPDQSWGICSLRAPLEALTASLHQLIELHGAAFRTHAQARRPTRYSYPLTDDQLRFSLYAAHRVPPAWIGSYERYYMVCTLNHGSRPLCRPWKTQKVLLEKSFSHYIRWNEIVKYPLSVASAPREIVLRLQLYGVMALPAGTSQDGYKQQEEVLGWASMPLFNFRDVLASGSKLLELCSVNPNGIGGGGIAATVKDNVILQIDFPESNFDVTFLTPKPESCTPTQRPDAVDEATQQKLSTLLDKRFLFDLSDNDKRALWDLRALCLGNCPPGALPLVLAGCPSWAHAQLPGTYALLRAWPPLSPVRALELLHATFPDQEVRRLAVSWIENLSDDELADYLPQLLQAVKHECHLDSALVQFLLARAMSSVNIAHYLYWLLKDTLDDEQAGERYQLVLGALLSCVGSRLSAQLEHQARLVHELTHVATRVRAATPGAARKAALREGLADVEKFFEREGECRLPLNPSQVLTGLNLKACCYFTSNTTPLCLKFLNRDAPGDDISVMFKTGDDLRQDMLTLQVMRVMESVWLQEGLDMRMVRFRCLSTGKQRGMVELVPGAETLRRIQGEHGVTGSFKDTPLALWLRKHNPSEQQYQQAVENFIYSCAGCCVATYVLGICDRHNDNIMLRTTGHMFHVDFGKFLGHAQMFGNIKRDRTPFVLTADMAYVMNGGDRPTSSFQQFVELCCQAYNAIRKHAGLLFNLLGLMMTSGIPELSNMEGLVYVRDALRPQATEAEAAELFTGHIKLSLSSLATRMNFFIHNLAQLRAPGTGTLGSSPDRGRPSLSIVTPRDLAIAAASAQGRALHACVTGYSKRYNPDKYYLYSIQVKREGHPKPSVIHRTFGELQELHSKLSMLFPAPKLPRFPNRLILGRVNTQEVAARRKIDISNYLAALLQYTTPEVAQCELVAMFLLSLIRDQSQSDAESSPSSPEGLHAVPLGSEPGGEVDVRIVHRNGSLYVLVFGCRGLVSPAGSDLFPCVKTLLLPDPYLATKRKTRVLHRTPNPKFNEMFLYSSYSREALAQRALQISVWSVQGSKRSVFLGAASQPLADLDLSHDNSLALTLGPVLD
ncbi:phosphatidylinositol 4-phosphate 3-kinase C2 domain-containing subunit beta-like isoform X2 [Petromyzon marinus]|uniref:phosphatidylinositol 4-phosphate 3-kinase C2 domain-containing subunit beta-like isoform X2 n=1 Tax=Petromyzon marinus TaxID=7757 RepID=UPI003F70C2F1